MSLASPTTVAGVKLGGCLMNGAYIGSKSLKEIKLLAASGAHAIVVGSITVKPRVANIGHGYWPHREKFLALNSYGMPNGGIPYFEEQLPAIVTLAHKCRKPLIANVAGFSRSEFITLIKLAEKSGADMVELNLGCPNVWDNDTQKRILSYHPYLVESLLKAIGAQTWPVPIGLKISPLPPDLLSEVCTAIAKSGAIQFVTATNTYPNAALTTGTKIDDDEELLAGFSGRALKPISLGVVRQLRRLLPATVDIIGCGGVSSASDANDYLRAGAKAVQIATALVEEGSAIFEKIVFQDTRN